MPKLTEYRTSTSTVSYSSTGIDSLQVLYKVHAQIDSYSSNLRSQTCQVFLVFFRCTGGVSVREVDPYSPFTRAWKINSSGCGDRERSLGPFFVFFCHGEISHRPRKRNPRKAGFSQEGEGGRAKEADGGSEVES